MVTRWTEKSPGLKIMWIWTLGTAAVVMANVVTTRLRDMDKLLKEEDAMRSQSDSAVTSSREEIITEE